MTERKGVFFTIVFVICSFYVADAAVLAGLKVAELSHCRHHLSKKEKEGNKLQKTT